METDEHNERPLRTLGCAVKKEPTSAEENASLQLASNMIVAANSESILENVSPVLERPEYVEVFRSFVDDALRMGTGISGRLEFCPRNWTIA